MNFDQFITGSSQLIALIGEPVAHSISPLIHNHAFRTLGLPYVYLPLLVSQHALHSAATLIRTGNFSGANVTIPHKSAITHYCDRLSVLSQATGTVNTLYRENGMLCGTTTDPEGFYRAIASINHPLPGSHVVILGNGGTAQTLAIALALEGTIASLTLVGRNAKKVEKLAATVQTISNFTVTPTTFDNPVVEECMRRCTLLVNCTSVGMYPNVQACPLNPALLHRSITVFDVIYNPFETVLLCEAHKRGCKTANGLSMLLYQGLASAKYWTGIDIPESLFDLGDLKKLIERA